MSYDHELVLVRHGHTAFNSGPGRSSEQRFRGWLNIPLDDEGREHAHSLAKRLLSSYPRPDRIVSSDLSRAVETARILKGVLHPTRFDFAFELRPWHIGDLAGKNVEENLIALKTYVAHPNVAPHGGEPFDTFRKRTLAFISSLLREAERDRATVIAVTHTRDVQLVKAWIKAGSRPDLAIDVKAMNDYSRELAPGDAEAITTPAAASDRTGS